MSAASPDTSRATPLVAQGIAALRAGDGDAARALLVAALQHTPDDPIGWLWLSGAVTSPAERRFCLERVCALDPDHPAARRGLMLLPAVAPVSPLGESAPPAVAPTPPAPVRGRIRPAPTSDAADSDERAGHSRDAEGSARSLSAAPPADVKQRSAPAPRGWMIWVGGSAIGVALLSVALLGLSLLTGPRCPATPAERADAALDAAALVARGIARERREADLCGALGDYTAAIDREPGLAAAYYWRAAVRARLGDGGSQSDYDRARQLDPDPARAAYHRGRLADSRGDPRAALAGFDEAIRSNPRDPQAHFSRAVTRTGLGDITGAYADLSAAIALDPSFAGAYYNRGNLLKDAGRMPEAVADYSAALRADPTFFAAYYNRGFVYRYAYGDDRRALADFDAAVRLRPDAVDARCERGGLRGKLGDYQGGLTDVNHALAIDPEWPCAYYTRGYLELGAQHYPRAIADFSRFIELVPRTKAVDAYIARGLSYSRSGDEAAAIADYSSAIAIAPASPLAYRNRGQSYVNLGDYPRAAEDWRTAADLYLRLGSDADAAQLMDGIARLPNT